MIRTFFKYIFCFVVLVVPFSCDDFKKTIENNYITSGEATFLVKENGSLDNYIGYYNNDKISLQTKMENSITYIIKIDETYDVYEKIEIEEETSVKGTIILTEIEKNNFLLEFLSDPLEESTNVNNFNFLVHDIFGNIWTLKFSITSVNSEIANLPPVADFEIEEYSHVLLGKYFKIKDKSYDKDADIGGYIIEWKIIIKNSKNVLILEPEICSSKEKAEEFMFSFIENGTYTVELQVKDNNLDYNNIPKKETITITSSKSRL